MKINKQKTTLESINSNYRVNNPGKKRKKKKENRKVKLNISNQSLFHLPKEIIM